MSGVRHRRPRLRRRFRIALLQQFDRMQIRRADEGHLAVSRRTVDGDAELHQPIAGRIDIVDLIGEMAEIAILTVFFLVPIVGEFDQRRAASLRLLQQALILGRAQEHQREFRLVIVDAADLLQSQRILIEFQRGIEIANAQHGVEITHGFWLPDGICRFDVGWVDRGHLNSSKAPGRAGPGARGAARQHSTSFFRVARKLRLRVPARVVPSTSARSLANVPEKPLVTSCPPNSGRAKGSAKGVCWLVRRWPFQVPLPLGNARWAFNSSIILQAAVPVAAARSAARKPDRPDGLRGRWRLREIQPIVKRVEYNCNINNLFIEASFAVAYCRNSRRHLWTSNPSRREARKSPNRPSARAMTGCSKSSTDGPTVPGYNRRSKRLVPGPCWPARSGPGDARRFRTNLSGLKLRTALWESGEVSAC